MTRDTNCIFCRIVAAEVPASVLYEDDAVLSFLDIGPLSEGHLLVVPREHYRELTAMPSAMASRLAATLPVLGRALLEVTGSEGFNVLCNQGRAAGQVVEHVHFHLIPRKTGDNLGYRWNAGKYAPGKAEEIVTAYQSAIGRHAH